MGGAKEQMIDAAERLAVERGIGAMSLREVQAASGQRNKSAAQYHFGSRDGLIDAVIARHMGPINERRLTLLEALPDDPTPRAVIEVLVEPLAEATLGRPDSRWARFLFQGWTDPSVNAAVRRSMASASYRRTWDLLHERVAHLPEPLRHQRVDQVVALVLMTLAACEAAADARQPRRLPYAAQVADLVDACAGLLAAPMSDATERELAERPRQRA